MPRRTGRRRTIGKHIESGNERKGGNVTWEDFAATNLFRQSVALGKTIGVSDDGVVTGMRGRVPYSAVMAGLGAHVVAQAARAPRVVKLDRLDAEALENAALTLTWGEYRQPFPVMVVEFPVAYQQSRVVTGEAVGEDGAREGRASPALVILHQYATGVSIVSVFDTPSVSYGYAQNVQREEIEEWFRDPTWHGTGCLSRSVTNATVANNAIRAALNAALLLVNYGTRQLPERKQVARRRRFNKRHGINEPVPRYFTFDQEVRLYKRRDAEPNPDAQGTPKRPHWRRGHWHRVPAGVGRSERKLAFFPAVLVNAAKLVGDQNNRIVYH